MAITILSAGHNEFTAYPSDYVSAHEDIWHVVESDNVNQSGFKYVFDIYKNGNLLTRVANNPYGNDKKGILNVSNIIRSSLTIDYLDIDLITPYSSGINVTSEGNDYWFTNYDVKYGEISGTIATGITITENMTSGSYRAYNTYNRHSIHKSGSRLSDSKIFLTNRPVTSNFYEGEPILMSINDRVLPVPDDYDILINNQFIQTQEAADQISFFSINGLTADASLLLDSKYGELGTYYFKKKCIKYKPYTLIFLNCYGGWDSFTFVNGNVVTDNEKKRYEANRWRLNAGYVMVDYATNGSMNTRYEGQKTYGVKFKTKMKLTSDILNTDEYIWMFELIVSPMVYLWDKDASYLYPVHITDSSYEIKNNLKNKAETVEVNIDVYDQNTQYR